ncbi:hypothetical protein, partial [uncultured Subdoligranulum sp.]|uniref:hypothetical protein n=1 Tax=uncultured Subdoligranulum sp. TaxID=512298 RepID=UPI0025CBD4B5
MAIFKGCMKGSSFYIAAGRRFFSDYTTQNFPLQFGGKPCMIGYGNNVEECAPCDFGLSVPSHFAEESKEFQDPWHHCAKKSRAGARLRSSRTRT